MAIRVFKYQLAVVDHQIVEIPHGAELLCVQTQYGVPAIWARVDDEHTEVEYDIFIVGTGHNADRTEGVKYLGSFQLQDGRFVGHVFTKLAR